MIIIDNLDSIIAIDAFDPDGDWSPRRASERIDGLVLHLQRTILFQRHLERGCGARGFARDGWRAGLNTTEVRDVEPCYCQLSWRSLDKDSRVVSNCALRSTWVVSEVQVSPVHEDCIVGFRSVQRDDGRCTVSCLLA